VQRVAEQCAASAALIRQLADDYAELVAEIAEVMTNALRRESKILVCGNGGSAADAQHFAAEMVGRFRKERQSLPVLALSTDTSILTAVGNDYGFDQVFLRQVAAFGAKGDVLVGISTSGNSANVAQAMQWAQAHGLVTVGLLGSGGGTIAGSCHYAITVPSHDAARIQECHGVIIHTLCDLIEEGLSQGSRR
jgi:D-sedoheptulose 7-phosphate isomerase